MDNNSSRDDQEVSHKNKRKIRKRSKSFNQTSGIIEVVSTNDIIEDHLGSSPLRKSTSHYDDDLSSKLPALNLSASSAYSSSSSTSTPRSSSPKEILRSISFRRRNSWGEVLNTNKITDPQTLRDSSRTSIHEIDLLKDNYVLRRKLGQGATSIVYQASVLGFIVAVKIFQTLISNQEDANEILKEINVMEQLSHPNIVKCLGHRISLPDKIVIFMEQCDLTLRESINLRREKDLGPQNLQQISHIVLEIASGLDFLHSYQKPIIHRDIKSENIFIQLILDENQPIIKIGDFGEAVFNHHNKEANVGTIEFRAPEMIANKKDDQVSYDTKVDIWALGMVLFEILTLEIPFHQEQFIDKDIVLFIKAGIKPSLPAIGSIAKTLKEVVLEGTVEEEVVKTVETIEAYDKLSEIYSLCTNFKAEKRPTANKLVKKLSKLFIDKKE